MTAKKWIHMGISTIAEASIHPYVTAKSDPRVSAGLLAFVFFKLGFLDNSCC